jgi:hypothetical protein
MATTTSAAQALARERDALDERLFGALLGGMELLSVDLGVRTGLYPALRDVGPATAGVLAGRAGIAARYASEWLEQQATAGFWRSTRRERSGMAEPQRDGAVAR